MPASKLSGFGLHHKGSPHRAWMGICYVYPIGGCQAAGFHRKLVFPLMFQTRTDLRPFDGRRDAANPNDTELEIRRYFMCILAIQYQLVPDSPILVAANREEFYDRPSQPPSIQSGKPRILCGHRPAGRRHVVGRESERDVRRGLQSPEGHAADRSSIARRALPRVAAVWIGSPGCRPGDGRAVHQASTRA